MNTPYEIKHNKVGEPVEKLKCNCGGVAKLFLFWEEFQHHCTGGQGPIAYVCDSCGKIGKTSTFISGAKETWIAEMRGDNMSVPRCPVCGKTNCGGFASVVLPRGIN